MTFLKWKMHGNAAPEKSDISSHHGIIKAVFAMDLHLERVVSTWRIGAAQVSAGIGISLH